MNIFEITQRRGRIRQAASDLVIDYLRNGIDDYETNVTAVSEMLWDDFDIKPAVADNMAKQIVSGIWDDAVAQANYEAKNAADSGREYYEARMGAY